MAAPKVSPGRLGRYVVTKVAGETVRAYVPPPLPPQPALELERLAAPVERAERALGRLDGAASVLPSPPLFLYMYVRKEALLSSQIEGTQSSLADLLLFESDESPGAPLADVLDVSNHVAALEHGLARLRGGFPLSLRLIREIHAILLSRGRGSGKQPGEFRRGQNWIGGTRPGNAAFVPPPPDRVMPCMAALETFIHAKTPAIPVLVKAGLVHLQFESIHPFLDGNGRLGRLLIAFFLCAEGVLREPLLYLSLFFKTRRAEYYDWLQRVRGRGDWEGWLIFFLAGVKETADQAVDTATRVLRLLERDRARIEALGRAAPSARRVHRLLETKPIVTIAIVAEQLGLTHPTAAKSIDHLRKLGILRETTGRRRGRRFVYDAYLRILDEGTEPLRRG